jgi:aryl-alcohol dehydrogenase-like predicted oxidoreductase
MIEGKATKEATSKWFETTVGQRLVSRSLGRTGLQVSAVGFGTYRVHPSVDQHRQALRCAIDQGVNLIDTSSNYGDGGAEVLIGQELGAYIEAGKIRREQMVVVTKVGYIQGQNLAIARAREAAAKPYAEVVKYSDDCWHCIHPEFIEDQLALSLSRLQLKCVDVLLLHNPEYFFMAELNKPGGSQDVEKMQSAFYDRIRRAFVCLEDLVDQGFIGSYGVSSNCFVSPTKNMDATNLEVMLEIAEHIAMQMRGSRQAHHFSVVQMPANLGERGAFEQQNCSGQSPATFAAEHKLGLLINRPLNCLTGRSLIRLADMASVQDAALTWSQAVSQVSQSLQAVENWLKGLDLSLQEQFGSMEESIVELGSIEISQVDLDSWRYWSEQRLLQGFTAWEQGVKARLNEGELERFASMWHQLWSALLQLVKSGDVAIRQKMHDAAQNIAKSCPGFDVSKLNAAPLQRHAVAWLIAQKPVTSVLVGMRREGYVSDAIAAAKPNS